MPGGWGQMQAYGSRTPAGGVLASGQPFMHLPRDGTMGDRAHGGGAIPGGAAAPETGRGYGPALRLHTSREQVGHSRGS